jgi:hypothetical protein
MNFNEFCLSKRCPEYIEWEYDNGAAEKPIYCTSCKLVGQSHDINEYPENCLYLEEIKRYDKEGR